MNRIPDSTLGDDENGFQKMANDRAKLNGTYTGVPKRAPIEMNSLQKGLASLLGRDKGVSVNVSSATAPDNGAKGLTYEQRFADGGEVMDPDVLAQMMQTQPDLSLSGGAPISSPPFKVDDGSRATPGDTNVTPPMPMPPPAPPVTANDAIHTMNTAGPAKNPIMDMSAKLAQTPNTPSNIYQGMTAEDRMAMQQKLMDSMRSPGQMVAQGAAGLGDAISNSFGGKNTHFQQDVMANNQKQMDNQLGAMDTARAQKLQDVQGNQEAQLNDPKSALSLSMAKTLQSAGLKIPAGMSGKVMLQIAGPLGELAMKQATLAVQQQTANATVANQDSQRKLEAAKELQDRSFGRKVFEGVAGDSDETKLLRHELTDGNGVKKAAPVASVSHGVPDLGGTFNGQKVLKVTRVK